MRPWLLLAAAGCQLPELPAPEPLDLFGGGDGLAPSVERVLTGTITEDLTLDAGAPWILDGLVMVGDDTHEVDLVIDPGTVVYGNPTTRGTLVIHRGSRIVADGTSAAPIVFTSPRARGARAAGDWGGLVINGDAPINGCPSAPCEAEGEGNSGFYGGDDPTDDSGILRYVRIEFAGALYSPEDELNGLALQGVGAGTTIDHVQLHVTADDGIEFFGGTVNVSHVLVTSGGDDSFDWTMGWSGTAQFVTLQQQPGVGDHGLEADNNEADFDAAPRSHPTLANLTVIGQAGSTGILLRRGTGATIVNSIVYGFGTGLDVNDDTTWDNAYDDAGVPTGEIWLDGNWFSCVYDWGGSAWDVHTVQSMLVTDFPTTFEDPLIIDPGDSDAPDFRLDPLSAALTAAVPTAAPLASVPYVGAFDAEDDWTAGWTVGGTN